MISDIQKAWRDGPCGPDGDIRPSGKEISYEDAFKAGVIFATAAERLRCALIARTMTSGPLYFIDGRANARAIIGGDLIAEAIEAGLPSCP